MAYVAIKPCRFAGQSFNIGESVPAELIQPGAAKRLVKMGIIAAQKAEGFEAATIGEEKIEEGILSPGVSIIIHAEEGDIALNPAPEGMQAVFDVLTSNVSSAEPIIKDLTDEDALILLHASDSRKSIKELAWTRAQDLAAQKAENAGEQ